MNNFVLGMKKFFSNKNVVTIILVIVVLVTLYLGYSGSIKKQTNPINMPVASKTINAQTQITSEYVVYKKIPNSMISENAIRNSGQILGKYTNINVTIPKGSLFYDEWLINGEELPGNWIEQLDQEKGEWPYYMSVNLVSTYGNNVLPNSYIDLYMKATDENGTIMYGKLMKNVKVLVVHDSTGQNVFGESGTKKTPAKIGFAVSQDMHMLLKNAEHLNIKLDIVPRGATVPEEDYIIVTSATLRDYIDAKTITIEEDVVEEVEDENSTLDENGTNENNVPLTENELENIPNENVG